MKTLFNSTSTSLATLTLATLVALNLSASPKMIDKDSPATDIKKVVVSGNAQVVLIQNAKEYIAVDDQDLEKVSFRQIGNTLDIKSTEAKPVVITVYVKEIFRIDAREHAKVKTAGKMKFENLQILLSDSASAVVKADTKSLYTLVSDHGNLTLAGKTDHHIDSQANYAAVDTRKLIAVDHEDAIYIPHIAANVSQKASVNMQR